MVGPPGLTTIHSHLTNKNEPRTAAEKGVCLGAVSHFIETCPTKTHPLPDGEHCGGTEVQGTCGATV